MPPRVANSKPAGVPSKSYYYCCYPASLGMLIVSRGQNIEVKADVVLIVEFAFMATLQVL